MLSVKVGDPWSRFFSFDCCAKNGWGEGGRFQELQSRAKGHSYVRLMLQSSGSDRSVYSYWSDGIAQLS